MPGAWTRPPEAGLLWTPGYWGYSGNRYRYYNGYWGLHIGYYGGIDYGFGYVGTGYQGGYWSGDRFNYNRAANNINTSDVRVYNRTVTNTVIINNITINNPTSRASYNGPGGVTRRPLPVETAAVREQLVPPMIDYNCSSAQSAAQNRQQFASVNKGRPTMVAEAKPVPAGKPIAPIVPARPAAAQSEPAHSQPNRAAEPVPGRPTAPCSCGPHEPAQPRKTLQLPRRPSRKTRRGTAIRSEACSRARGSQRTAQEGSGAKRNCA